MVNGIGGLIAKGGLRDKDWRSALFTIASGGGGGMSFLCAITIFFGFSIFSDFKGSVNFYKFNKLKILKFLNIKIKKEYYKLQFL